MIGASDLDRELAVTEGTVRSQSREGKFFRSTPSRSGKEHTITLPAKRSTKYGRRWAYRRLQRRQLRGSSSPLFNEMDMSASYKPVLLLSFLSVANSRGRAPMSKVVHTFRQFYEDRAKAGLVVERAGNRMARWNVLSDADVQRVIVEMPLKKYQQRRYLDYARDVAYVQFNSTLWHQLSKSDLHRVREICRASIESYYERLR